MPNQTMRPCREFDDLILPEGKCSLCGTLCFGCLACDCPLEKRPTWVELSPREIARFVWQAVKADEAESEIYQRVVIEYEESLRELVELTTQLKGQAAQLKDLREALCKIYATEGSVRHKDIARQALAKHTGNAGETPATVQPVEKPELELVSCDCHLLKTKCHKAELSGQTACKIFKRKSERETVTLSEAEKLELAEAMKRRASYFKDSDMRAAFEAILERFELRRRGRDD